ncbi:hypothetical protein VZT92_012644 [Zoarces viviparus]|uniref:DUF4550 domain-containing protein n=1 Tax=Zoarces viviparus TaxID=48416 RepID=A0AAW1F2C5_ZOAVI
MEHGLENRSSSTEDITTCTDDSAYYVTWAVYIALALPREEDVDAPENPGKARQKDIDLSTGLIKSYRSQSCYHIEYKLLPDDTQTVKVDLVVFGPVAKIYKEDEFKMLRLWQEGDQAWVGWSQDFKVRVNRELLIGLLPHKITLQIWNSKDKLSHQACYERLKAFRLTRDQPEDASCGGIETMVKKLRSSCESKWNRSDILFNSNSEVGSETKFQQPTIDAFKLEDIKQNGTVSAEISPIHLLAGETSLTQRFRVCSCGVFEVVCNISLNSPLISDQLKAELNPLVITIMSATSMPSSPVPFHVLQEKCLPAYCQYKFNDFNMHRTKYHKHGTKIYFRDMNVILTGLISPEELREFLSGPPLEIEVHDRDRKLEGTPETPATFATGSGSDSLCGAVVGNSHGVARLNLSELLLGKKSLKEHLQIKCCPPPPLPDRERNRKRTDTAASREPMPPGHYVDANSQLKVEVEISCPLNIKDDSCDNPFGRIIYIFDYNNFSLMTKLRSEIVRINASALHLDSRSLENMEQALSNYTMNFKHGEGRDLDFVTGFYVLDKRSHIFVLEGLKHRAVRRLWEAFPMKLSGSEEEQVIVLYNSSLSFFKRIYSLDMSLTSIHLNESLETIMRQPLVYIRGMIPQPCFQALLRLSQLRQARQLKDVVQCNLFPSAEMILDMSKNCGTHAKQRAKVDTPTRPVRTKRHAPLNTHNGEHAKCQHNSQPHNQDNVKKVQEESERVQKPKAAVFGMEQSASGPVHRYSIQTVNSREHPREQLRRMMAEEPGWRFPSSQPYHRAVVEQGRASSKNGSNSTAAPAVWLTSMRSNDSKVHPRHPDEARVEELRKQWRENILHGNILKPTLSRAREPAPKGRSAPLQTSPFLQPASCR